MIACPVLILCFAVWMTSGMETQKSPSSCSVCGSPGIPGSSGVPGNNGVPGSNGIPGKDGKGQRGSQGIKGDKGDTGKEIQGPQGISGKIGATGDKGQKGEHGAINWKQCVWKSDDGKDSGLLYHCSFTKKDGSTSLKVSYLANARVSCPGTQCCGRWYFTFNSKECSSPMTIEGVVYVADGKSNALNPHRPRVIEGACEKLPAGSITVAVHVGNCPGYATSDRYSGWNSVSRIMIEEYPPPQK